MNNDRDLIATVADTVTAVKTAVDGGKSDPVDFKVVLTALKDKLDKTESDLDAYSFFAPETIQTAKDADELAGYLKQFTTAKKDVDEARKEVTRPLDSFKKMVMGAFKPTLSRLDETTDEIKAKLTAFQVAEAQRVEAEKAEAERQYLEDVATSQNPEYVGMAPVKEAEKVSGVRTIKKTVATVEDLSAFLAFAIKNPEFLEFVSVNESALGTTLGKLGAIKVDGVKVEEVISVSSR